MSEKNTSMNIRMNKDVKLQAQKVFSDLGIDLTTAVNVFLRQSIRYQGFPFDVTLRLGTKRNNYGCYRKCGQRDRHAWSV
ncbi:MAG: type II toxin-antitoxin system RelB/DinJ family antitoxin [Veillonella parvula]